MSEYLALMEFYVQDKLQGSKINKYGAKNHKIIEKELKPINEYQREY